MHEHDAKLQHVVNCATEHVEERRPDLDASKWHASTLPAADYIVSGDVSVRVDLSVTVFEWRGEHGPELVRHDREAT
ncbi:hypothetical protein [Streptomyces sp. R44]|uniref:Uncharacterized protein n=1 Tax=Streptomyces sp. R44 TaxID=3238633 RepID=A0AB39TAP5_9ACTN